MGIEVHKFGGDVMSDPRRIQACANEVATLWRNGNMQICAVVSAARGRTDQIISHFHEHYDQGAVPGKNRQLDLALSAGETESAGYMAGALAKEVGENNVAQFSIQGVPFNAYDSIVSGEARIGVDIKCDRLHRVLNSGKIIVMPGFIAVDLEGMVRTLGRSGSDLSAVALAYGFAQETRENVPVIFSKSVARVLAAPPDYVTNATSFNELSTEDCISLIMAGDHPFISLQAARTAQDLGVDMIFRQGACFVDPGKEVQPGTSVRSKLSSDKNFKGMGYKKSMSETGERIITFNAVGDIDQHSKEIIQFSDAANVTQSDRIISVKSSEADAKVIGQRIAEICGLVLK